MHSAHFDQNIPPIVRARQFRLYTKDGQRLTDLWQADGRALLGHTPASLLRELKNTAERGLYAPFPHPQSERFLKALSSLFPQYGFRVYTDELSLRKALEQTGFPFNAAPPDPCFCPNFSFDHENVPILTLWRPFLDLDYRLFPYFIPILPFCPPVLAFQPNKGREPPPSDTLSPIRLAVATRCVYDLIATPQRSEIVYPKITQAFQRGIWHAKGIYFRLAKPLSEAAYTALWNSFLSAGFLLPPRQTQPAILPPALSHGEQTKLANALSCTET